MTAVLLGASVVLLIANGLFVAAEFALVASRRAAVEPAAAGGNRRAERALAAMGTLNLQLAGAQLGITVASLGLGAVAEPSIAHLLESGILAVVELPERVVTTIGFVLALSIVVFLHLVFGELVPKSLAIAAPERTLLVLSGPMRAFVVVSGPLLWALNAMANGLMRLLRVTPRDELGTAHTPDELSRLFDTSLQEGILDDAAHELLAGALDFGARPAGTVVVPAARVIGINRATTVEAAEALAVAHGVSRLVVRSEDGSVIGFVHVKDLLALSSDARSRPVPLVRIRRALVLSADASLESVLLAMRRSRTHLAAVVGADGSLTGILTLEDVLEQLVGDIVDESD